MLGIIAATLGLIETGKRRSTVVDDLGSGGPMRRIWQKADLCSHGSSISKHKSEFVSSDQRLILSSKPKEKAYKEIVENGLQSVESSKFLLSTENNQKPEALDFKVLDDDNHSIAPVEGNTPTTNAASTLALIVERPQKKQAFQDFEVLDDDNHSTAPLQGNVPTTNAASTLALR
nr:nuclear pore complex protein NUP1-like [Tanacetum cinerariifolium]